MPGIVANEDAYREGSGWRTKNGGLWIDKWVKINIGKLGGTENKRSKKHD